jgi:hypothetical protein
MKKAFFICLLILNVNQLFAQELQTAIREKKNTFLFAPINLLDFVNPSLQIGYERLLTERLAYQIEAAYIINHSLEEYFIDLVSGIKDCEYTNKGFRIGSELKYIFLKKRKINLYSSVEIFYMQNRSGVVGTFEIVDNTFQYSTPVPDGVDGYDEFFINDKKKMGLNLKYGLKIFPRAKSFTFEPHIGLGIAYRRNKHFDRENPNDTFYGDFLTFHLKDENAWVFNFPLNIKLGYRF